MSTSAQLRPSNRSESDVEGPRCDATSGGGVLVRLAVFVFFFFLYHKTAAERAREDAINHGEGGADAEVNCPTDPSSMR